MSDIPSLIKMLQSNNSDKRYDACEELRVLSWLPQEVFDALRSATNDSNSDVTDAAQRALALHTKMKKDLRSNYQNQSERETPQEIIQHRNLKTGKLAGLLAGFAMGIIIPALVFEIDAGRWNFYVIGGLCGAIFGLLGGYISGLVSKKFGSLKTAFLLGIILGSCFGSFGAMLAQFYLYSYCCSQ